MMDKKNNLSYFISGTLILVFLIYFSSLNRPWLFFDEHLIYEEVLLPAPKSLQEVFEIIFNFVPGLHLESMNTFFSNIHTVRSQPVLTSVFTVIFNFIFKNNAFYFHLLQLIIHMINTALVWLILNKITQIFYKGRETLPLHLISMFTLIWALHPANIEAVLLTTNWNMVLMHTFCFGFLFYEIAKMGKHTGLPLRRFIFIPILFFISMSFAEHAYTFPLVLFFILLAMGRHTDLPLPHTKTLFFITAPYLIGIVIFISYFLIRTNGLPAQLIIERNLWLTPQIFLHLLKLLFFPKTLSVYQSNLINFSSSAFEIYSIFSTLVYLLFIVSPVLFLIRFKNCLFFLIFAFLFSLFPFLQILAPTYCLASERYLYFPSFVAVLIVFRFIVNLDKKHFTNISIFTTCILFILTARTITRINDWGNGEKLILSAINIEKKPLFKAQKQVIYADHLKKSGRLNEMEKILNDALINSKLALNRYDSLKKLHINQPASLRFYGLDYDSLSVKSAYLISTIETDFLTKNPNEVSGFYEPYIKDKLNEAFINEITFYASILTKTGRREEAIKVLEGGLKRFPYSSSIIHSLINYSLADDHAIERANELLKEAKKYFSNDPLTLVQLIKYYTLKNDLPNQAKYAYLHGLRTHNVKSYQFAANTYLNLKALKLAKKPLDKLLKLDKENNVTLLLQRKYKLLADEIDNQIPQLN